MKPNISKILKELRSSNNKTQREIAEFLGITRQAYSRYESSLRDPSMDTLAKLSDFYNVSPQIFFMGDIDKPIDAEMDIVELSAIIQAKKAVYSHDNTNEDKNTDESETEHNEELDEMEKMLVDKLDLKTSIRDLESRDDLTLEEISLLVKKKKRRKIKLYILYILIVLTTINIGFMTIHRLDSLYEYPIINHSYINAISPGQNVNQTMYTDIVKITKFNGADAKVGDLVIIYSDFGIDEYWTEEITSIDFINEEISTTYDEVTTKTVSFSSVLGSYEKESNFVGSLYYTSKFNTGFLFIVTGQLLFLTFYYYTFLEEKRRDYRNEKTD